jgi:hypothetical protein
MEELSLTMSRFLFIETMMVSVCVRRDSVTSSYWHHRNDACGMWLDAAMKSTV